MRDFSLVQYRRLLAEIKAAGYSFPTIEQYFTAAPEKAVVLRHDVDSWPVNALQMANAEAEAGALATYYFRMSPLSFNPEIIRKIITLGHEIGYHYEDLATQHGNQEKALDSFGRNLAKLRNFYPIKTAAMHGKPLSRHNNLDIWQKADYRSFGLIGEPYLSIDFDQVLYLTDTGNCWDGHKYSIRDEVKSSLGFPIHSTDDLIRHLEQGLLPEQIMLNIHPARWNDNLIKWLVRYYILTLPKYTAKKWVKQWRNRKK